MEDKYLTGEKYGINNALLTYICDGATGSEPVAEEELLPSVAYLKDNVIADTMFDSFIFLPQPNYLFAYSGVNDMGYAPLNKNDWEKYIHQEVFMPGMNTDALDAAAGRMKSALSLEDYKVNVIFALFYPVRAVTSFGIVNGKELNLSDLEDRKAAVKWMVNEYISVFTEKNYKNIKLSGFYWFSESIDGGEKDPDIKEIIRYITDYIRSLGLSSLWLPYFLADGYDKGRDYGIDLVAMQANFFPSKDLPNAGNKDRLYANAELTRKCNIGFEIEAESTSEEAIAVLKEYYRVGLEKGYVNAFHAFYMHRGPVDLYDIYRSDQSYIRSAYDETYKFLHNTLKEEDIADKP